MVFVCFICVLFFVLSMVLSRVYWLFACVSVFLISRVVLSLYLSVVLSFDLCLVSLRLFLSFELSLVLSFVLFVWVFC